jgi:hypothetical protein
MSVYKLRLQIKIYILRFDMSFETIEIWHSSDTPVYQRKINTFTSNKTRLVL